MSEVSRWRFREAMVEVRWYLLLSSMFAGTSVSYWWIAREWAGTVLFALAGGLTAITGGYLLLQARLDAAIASGDRPDPVEHEAAAGTRETELYLPHTSIWPLELAAGATVTLLGLVLGRWVLTIGLVATVHATAGWALQSRRRT